MCIQSKEHGCPFSGLENMYKLLNNSRSYKLRVDMRLFTGETGYAQYDTFLLEPETNAYKIYVSGHSGTASTHTYNS